MLISWQVFSSRFLIGLSLRPSANSGNWARNAVTNAALSAADGSLLIAGAGAGAAAAAGDVVDVAATAGAVVVAAAVDVVVDFCWEVSLSPLHPVRATAAAMASGKAIRMSFTDDYVKRCV